MPRPSQPAELAIIAQIRRAFSRSPTRGVPLGIGDDCAILRPPPNHDLLVTTDFSLEGRHFRRDLHPAHAVGHRTLARGLSDLAAMGATPLAAFLSLALPATLPRTTKGKRWIAQFLAGLRALAEQANVPLAGGDTAQAPADHILADIVLLGSAPRNTALRRSGARPGDHLYVTGQLGGAAAELQRLLGGRRSPSHPHLYPQPRLRTGRALRRRATACIDLSDGLSTDLTHLCQASKVHAELDASALPLYPLATLNQALHGGEDYELLFTAPPTTRLPRTLAGVPLTRIGRILPSTPGHPTLTLLTPDHPPTPLLPSGWQHFVS